MATTTVAQGARSQLLLKKQTALGTVATGNFTKVRFNTHSLDVSKSSLEGEEIRSDREVQDFRHGNRNAVGDIVCDLVYGDHETLIESGMFSTFDTDSIAIGTSPQYLSIEDGALDISQYRMFNDMVVSTMAMSIQTNQMVRATFGLVGTDGDAPATSSSGGTPVAASTNQPFDSFTGSVFDNTAETGNEIATITGIDFQVDNSVGPAFVVGQQTPAFLEYGRGRVSGSMTCYYDDAKWINRFLQESEVALVVNLSDPDANIMEFRFPRVKFSGASVPVANEQSRIISLPFQALRDTTLGTAFQISKL